LAGWIAWKLAAGGERARGKEPLRPVPSASASASSEPVPVVPPVFNQALPPLDAGPLKPPLK